MSFSNRFTYGALEQLEEQIAIACEDGEFNHEELEYLQTYIAAIKEIVARH